MLDKNIAGVNPVAYTDNGDGLFTKEQIRELMIEFIHTVDPDDLDGRGMMYGLGRADLAKRMEADTVDAFMNPDK